MQGLDLEHRMQTTGLLLLVGPAGGDHSTLCTGQMYVDQDFTLTVALGGKHFPEETSVLFQFVEIAVGKDSAPVQTCAHAPMDKFHLSVFLKLPLNVVFDA